MSIDDYLARIFAGGGNIPLPGPTRLTTDQLQIVYLDEIAGRLGALAEQNTRARSEGILWSREETVSTDWGGQHAGWRSATVFNDGAADIYIRTDREDRPGAPWDLDEAPIKSGESVRFASEKGKEKVLEHITQSGTSTVRIFFSK